MAPRPAPRSGASFLVLLFAVLGAFVAGPSAATSGRGAPLSYRFAETAGGVGAHLLRADLDRVQLKLLYAQDLGAKALSARQFLERSGATAVFNGPFFDLDGSPMGLLIVDGVERVGLRPVDWGVFQLDESGPSIVHTRDWKPSPEVLQAFQVGPRLVVDGAALTLKRQSARRTALCVLPGGHIEVLVAGTPLWADDLAEFFVAEGCSDALNLDGGTSSQFYLRRAGIVVEEPGGVPVPVAVGLFVAEEHAEVVPRSGCRSRLACR
jgi:uncharacterized protein YigE (DUF2233 family)